MSPNRMWMRAAAIAALAAQVAGQQCYYPNGASAPATEKACSSASGSACCPDNWECLDNGLCYYAPSKLWGRYSCTDKTWASPGCASNMCTYSGTAGGAESITQCSNHDNNWCCNGDATNVNCCQESPAPRPFFALQDGNAYATIGTSTASAIRTLSGITGLATSASGTGISTTSRSSSTSAGSRSNTATATVNSVSTTASAFTSVVQSVTSGSAGVATIYITSVVTPTAASTADSSSGGGSSNLGLIVGCAVGIPLGLALIGIVFWMLRKRRNQKANPYELDGDSPNSSGIAGGAAAAKAKKEQFRHSRPGTAEIDGNPVGVGRPVSTVTGHAELAAGQGFQPGHGTPYAPDTVGLGGGSTAGRDSLGSQPPQYSPPATQTGFNHSNAVEMDGTSAMPAINEKAEYQAYKLPDGVAELPSVKTPPEDVEKQLTK